MASLDDLDLEEIRAIIDGSGEEGLVVGELTGSVSAVTGTDRERDRLRVPWVFTSRVWVRQNPPRKIVMWVNPGTINVDMPKRASVEKTAAGMVMHQIKIRGRDNVFDEFAFTFEANTGNIMPITLRNIDGVHTPAIISPGLVNHYDMHELNAQSHQVEDTGEPNFIYVYLSTPLYPTLTLVGWFDPQSYSFGEDAENPHGIKYNLKMEVLDTEPKLTSSSALLQAFREANGVYMAIPKESRV